MFLRRLSDSEFTNWLLILDDADDLEGIRLEDYIPKVHWGHVIITTRDQNALNSISPQGRKLGELTVKDAVSVLLQKAGVSQLTPKENEDAEAIVGALGCHALAVDHAGSYIKACGRSLSSFFNLYHARKREILDAKPRLTTYETTVFMTWHANFKEVERRSKDATQLLMLFCFLDHSVIPEMLLDRASRPQNHWARSGEMFEQDPTTTGLIEGLTELIKDGIRFDKALNELFCFSLIHLGASQDGLRNFSIHPLVQYCAVQHLSVENQDHWRSQAILAVCHAFPMSEQLDPV